tara:strand:+ start:378 stop:1025 length:648 start_codon:yes stop_codon:yes gene_type:complete
MIKLKDILSEGAKYKKGQEVEYQIDKGSKKALRPSTGKISKVNKVRGSYHYTIQDGGPVPVWELEIIGLNEGKLNEGKYDYLVGSWIDIIKQPKRIFHIIKIEDDRFVHVKDQRENTSMFGIDTVKKSNPKLFKKKQRAAAWNKGQKTISQSKYQSILKGAMKDMKGEGYEEFTHDVAESMILDASLVKRLTKDYPTLNISQLTQRLQWDLENYI